jgi:RHS repeat-associated protein
MHNDKQNSVIAISDAVGNPVQRRGYGTYGETDPAQMVGTTTAGTSPHPFGYTGRRWDPDLGLYYYRARWYDPQLGTFIETDPIGSLDYINLYAYVGLEPGNGVDPSGMECIVSSNGNTRCISGNYDVTFPTPRGFRNTNTSSSDYHYYGAMAASPNGVSETRNWVRFNPTPAIVQGAASSNGTINDATPFIGGVLPFRISPVTSLTTINRVTGNEVVVNVTLFGHPLGNGIVVRDTVAAPNGQSTIQNWGEGNGFLQSSDSNFATILNRTFVGHKPAPLRKRRLMN